MIRTLGRAVSLSLVVTACAPPAPIAVLELSPFLGTGLRILPVTVSDTTLPFLFDTGGGVTFLTPATATALGCDPFGRMTGFRHNGDPVHIRRCPPAVIEMDGWAAPVRETGVFDLMALFPEGVPEIGGLVALNTFDGLAITLDLGERIVIESEASLKDRVASMREVPYRQGQQSGGAMVDPFLSCEAPGGPLWFELDSGNNGPVLIAPHAADQLGLDLSADEPSPVTLDLSGFGPVTVEAVEKEMIYDGLVNAEFLSRYRVTLDLARKRAWVQEAGSRITVSGG